MAKISILFGGDKIYITQNSEIRYSEIVEPKGLAKIQIVFN